MEETNVKVEFIAICDEYLDTSILTEELDIIPEKAWKKGDEIIGKPIQRRDTTWIVSTQYEPSLDINVQLDKVIKKIENKTSSLQVLREKYNLQYIFAIVVNVEDNQKPAMHFNQRFIKLANSIHAEFYIDLYIY